MTAHPHHPPLLLLAGPTASGKSGLALDLARRCGASVVNADALQVYDCWQVLTARPNAAEQKEVSHLLYGFLPAFVWFSAGAWARELATLLQRSDRPLIICGGTGLYFHAILNGLSPIPDVPPEVRAEGDALRRGGGVAAFEKILRQADPELLGRIDRANPARLQRAWEVWRSTGKPLSAWQGVPGQALIDERQTTKVVLAPDPAVLNEHISRRFRAMLADGAEAEVAAWLAEGHDLNWPAGRALGARELAAMLRGEITREAAFDLAVTATRRYAKRQRTWARSRMADWSWHEDTTAAASALALWPG